MSNVPRGWTQGERSRKTDASRWPVLARLPEVPVDSLTARSAKPIVSGGVEYRFDPPLAAEAGGRTPGSAPSAVSQQPHMYERDRPIGQRGFPRRESPVLPRTNPFSNPRPRLVDSVAPAVRFLTMVALFTAAGVWVQMMGHQTPAPIQPLVLPKTAAQPVVAPAKNANDHTVPAPTATGPIETQPESGARVGRAEGDDFASRSNSAVGPVLTGAPTVTPPHFLISSGSSVPRVRVLDSTPTVPDDAPVQGAAVNVNDPTNGELADGTESDDAPTMARYPGFFMDLPTR